MQLGAYTAYGKNFTWLYDGTKVTFDNSSWELGNLFNIYDNKTVIW
jgi:hypothetical protein